LAVGFFALILFHQVTKPYPYSRNQSVVGSPGVNIRPRQEAAFGRFGLPLYVLVSPSGKLYIAPTFLDDVPRPEVHAVPECWSAGCKIQALFIPVPD
jgi:hypothetical protein